MRPTGATSASRHPARVAMSTGVKIVSLVKRNGEKRSFRVASVTAATVTPILKEHIARKARVMTDELAVYNKLDTYFAEHGVVNHSKKEYVRFDITTNTVESSFAVLKRGLYGTFHSVSEQHLQRYVTEFDFKWNTRQKLGFDDTQRTAEVLKNIGGKRLTYKRANSLEISIAS